ncbi:uncharacterized protein N7518_001449 [Penicillium psychrosexuale]|uniref:uncharacterized protein n=1 Tax=Penicillium psychrosexuale TaxID=1002107 RepID=UPI002544EEA8|nr:uncharacterized protein N7518_001449 [Penicillium psychrosexuale]KAJ5799381.1 hypothetical protein N7518_001449 [Penicillium psychrosexuale]
MSASSPISDYQTERTNFLSWLEDQARLIRLQPKPDTIAEVKVSLREQGVEYVGRLTQASLATACEENGHNRITAIDYFYKFDVPKICNLLRIRMPQLALRLGINPKCDMCVHFIIMNILAEPGF